MSHLKTKLFLILKNCL